MRVWLALCFATLAIGQCFIEYTAHDQHGFPVPIIAIGVESAMYPEGNFLMDLDRRKLIHFEPGRLTFQTKPNGNVLTLTVRSSDGKTKSVVFGWSGCETHITFLWNEITSPDDSSSASLRGRVRGCNCAAGIWVRIVPMFGASNSSTWAEGVVSKRDCGFDFGATIRGERQIVVFGKNIDPFAVRAYNAQENGRHDLGVVDLGKECRAVGLSK